MAHETSKQATRRGADRRYATRWLVGEGIDIGCGEDPLGNLAAFFPLMRTVRPWDIPDGDAMLMAGAPDAAFDFVHSSHCLEHLVDPAVALSNWIRICRPGGHIVVTIPDEDLYEQGVWPSTFNTDHKWSFTIAKAMSWSPRSVNLFDLIWQFIDEVEIVKLELLDAGFSYGLPRHDQSRGMLSESAIEFVLRKRVPVAEGRMSAPTPEALFETAVAHHAAGRTEEAVAAYRATLAARPGDPASLNNLALLSGAEEAEGLLRAAVAARPDYADAWMNLGRTLLSRGQPGEADACFARLVAMGLETAEVAALRGQALEAQGRPADAAAAYRHAHALDPARPDLLVRLAKLSEGEDATEAAVTLLDAAIALDPAHVDAHVTRGFAELKLGRYREGAAGIARLWQAAGIDNPPGRLAPGVDLTGQTLVLTADSGLGDALQFCRYGAVLREQGAHVVIECQPELVRLLEGSGVADVVLPIGAPLPAFDLRVPMHNLIGVCATEVDTVPAAVPYLAPAAAEAARWAARLNDHPGLKVGLVWAGNPAHIHDGRRSLPPALLAPLLGVPGATFVSLQKGAARTDMVDWTTELGDMADTAALVAGLDLVVSIDSAVAHLAGALGRPVWLLNRFDSCWRWLKHRSDSPWYPTMRQFRQPAPGAWPEVMAEVATALAGLTQAPASRRPRRAVRSRLA